MTGLCTIYGYWAYALMAIMQSQFVFSSPDQKMMTGQANSSFSWQSFLHCSNYQHNFELYSCIRSSSREHNLYLRRSLANENHPRPLLVGLVTYLTSDIASYSCYSLAINLAYAIHNHYLFYIVDQEDVVEDMDDYDVRWNKINLLKLAMRYPAGFAWDTDYLLWLDADIALLDLDYSLSDIIAGNSKAHIIVSAEHAGSSTLINSGAILCKTSSFSLDFLALWYNTSVHRKYYSDQESFDLLYTHMQPGPSVAILPPYVLNTDPPAMTKLQPHHKVLHLMGEENEYRKRAFRLAYEDLMLHMKQVLTYDNFTISNDQYDLYNTKKCSLHSPQLQLSQSKLLYLTVEVYYDLAMQALQETEQVITESKYITLAQTKRLSNTVHHYIHALEYVLSVGLYNIEENTREVLSKQLFDNIAISNPTQLSKYIEQSIRTLRSKVYNLLKQNLLTVKKTYRSHFMESGGLLHDYVEILVDYPELVKQVAIVGQHLLLPVNHSYIYAIYSAINKSQGKTSERGKESKEILPSVLSQQQPYIMSELHLLLQEMLNTSNFLQHPAIYHMKAFVYQQQGLFALSAEGGSCYDCGAHYLEAYYNLSYSLSKQSGEYGMIIPALLYANALSLNKLYSLAEKIYMKGVDVANRYLPTYQTEYLQLLLNYGMALYAQGKKEEADKRFGSILEICVDLGVDNEKNSVYKVAKEYLQM